MKYVIIKPSIVSIMCMMLFFGLFQEAFADNLDEKNNKNNNSNKELNKEEDDNKNNTKQKNNKLNSRDNITNISAEGHNFFGFGVGGSVFDAGVANIGIWHYCAALPPFVHPPITEATAYNARAGVLSLIQAGRVLGDNLTLEIDLGMKKYPAINEKSVNQAFFNLTTFFANAQAKITLANNAIFKPYVGFGTSINYNKIDFSPMTEAVADLETDCNCGSNCSCGGSGSCHVYLGMVSGFANAAHLALIGSAGLLVSANDGLAIDVGYTGKYPITNAEFVYHDNFAHLAPVSHAVAAKVKMYT